jgi:hypothetical protein
MSKSQGEWKFNRGSLKAHFIADYGAVCGSGSKYESATPNITIAERYKCVKCLASIMVEAKLKEGSGTK